jgi:chromosome segregation ATPase
MTKPDDTYRDPAIDYELPIPLEQYAEEVGLPRDSVETIARRHGVTIFRLKNQLRATRSELNAAVTSEFARQREQIQKAREARSSFKEKSKKDRIQKQIEKLQAQLDDAQTALNREIEPEGRTGSRSPDRSKGDWRPLPPPSTLPPTE